MIYFVTGQKALFLDSLYKIISVEESLQLLKDCKVLQYDSETSGRDPHICELKCIQFGSKSKDFQIVIDISTVNILHYKDILEDKLLIGQNLKFDLQFLYNYNIIPLYVYDTMIVEQYLYLGWSSNPAKSNFISCSLASIAKRRLNIDIDKSIRGQIIWRGLDTEVILYAANDVKWLEDIMRLQIEDLRKANGFTGAKLECDFVPVIAYLEWCGIMLDENLWEIKMQKDLKGLEEARKALDDFVIRTPELSEFIYYDRQGNLFTGFDTSPKVNISWTSSQQVIKVAKKLGFDTKVKDAKTGEDKESVIEKHLKKQKGINDEFLRLYFGKGEEGDDDYFAGHQGSQKLVTSFGQNHLNAINPITHRIHTQYYQLGADTGRMSCGSTQNNNDLAKIKGLPIDPSPKQRKEGKACPYPNMQQLPNDEFTRACFIADKGNLWVSCDYSARLKIPININ